MLNNLIKEVIRDIRKQADAIPDGWLEIILPEIPELNAKETKIKVPRIPYERWTHIARTHRFDEWKNISPSGMKMAMDDRNHTDWWLGAGLKLEHCHIREDNVNPKNKHEVLAAQMNRVAWEERMAYNSYDGYMFLVKPKKPVEGMVMWVRNKPEMKEFVDEAIRWSKAWNKQGMIAVVPNASIDFSLIMPHAAGVITQQGNKVAHLVVVARENKNVPVVLCPDAYQRFFNGEHLSITKERVRRKTF